jgi:hypothetical protein
VSPRHEPAAWVCNECPRDANVSARLPDGRRVHLCVEHRDLYLAVCDAQQIEPEMRWVAARRGVCRVCGCTDERACAEGCSWANRERTVCSACALARIEGVLETMVSEGLLRKVSP